MSRCGSLTLSDIAPDASDGLDTEEPTTPQGDEISRLLSENAALKEQVLRVAADAENAKRRAEKEGNDARAYAIQRFARDLLDAADTLGRAVASAPKDVADQGMKNFVAGVEMTEKQLQTAFERNGLKRLSPARGDRFDPHVHQAMMEQEAEGVAPGAVTAVMQPGYELFGRTVRPAMVAVTPRASAATTASGGNGAANDAYGSGDGTEPGGSVDARA